MKAFKPPSKYPLREWYRTNKELKERLNKITNKYKMDKSEWVRLKIIQEQL